MALYADRVKDSASITGTGAVTLSGTASAGYQTFATAFGATPQTVAYCIADQTGSNWEVGTGVFNGTTGLTRVTVLASSNGGSLVAFTGGTQDVFCTAPAAYLLPAGANTQIQYNNAGVFGANANFTYTVGTSRLSVPNLTLTSGSLISSAPFTLNVTGGDATYVCAGNLVFYSTGAVGKNITFTAGSGVAGGQIQLNGGLGSTGPGGSFQLYGGDSASDIGGDCIFFPGAGAVANGSLILSDGNIYLVQCQYDTATSQSRMGFFNAAPVAQPAPTASGPGNVLSAISSGLNSLGLFNTASFTNITANFTSAAQGFVPASGGGTSNFLRADGTFAAPPSGTPASPTTSVQYNNGGSFGGASTFTYNSGTDTLSVGKLVSATFTSSAQGLVPASGGGTANFLRADGTFAAPPATTPAGSTYQIQYNYAGTFGASSNFTYDVTNTLTIGPAGNNVNSTITTVAPIGSVATGILRLLGTNASATNGFGGGVTITTGNGTGTQRGGNFILTSGNGGFNGVSYGGVGGNITLTSGIGRIGGNFTMTSGFGSVNNGGAFTMSSGQGTTNGGNFSLTGGDGGSNGGSVNIQSGSTFAGVSGNVNIQSGQGGAGGNGTLDLQFGAIRAKWSGGGDDPTLNQLGFYQTTPVDKQTVSGSRATGAALQSLLLALSNLGLITDSTSV